MTEPSKCEECGAVIPDEIVLGSCPACLFSLSASSAETVDPFPTPGLVPGYAFGSYELQGKIGEGGMGVVYKAKHKTLGRTVALKLVRLGSLASEKTLKRFQIEARAAAALQHPNLVAVHEVGEEDGQLYIAMEYVAGERLSDAFRSDEVNWETVAKQLKSIAEAVQHAHQQGIIHRDLKPANVLINSLGEPCITDFGLAKIFDHDEGFTASEEVMGTPSYMSPEQAKGDKAKIGPATDIYALGAILYEGLTGRPPFKADSSVETVRQVVELDPVFPQRLNPNVPRQLQTICMKCLSKDPGKRYSTAQELVEDLDRFLKKEPIHAKPTGTFERVKLWANRKPELAWSLTLVSVLFVLLMLASFQFREDTLNGNRFSANHVAKNVENTLTGLKNSVGDPVLSSEIKRQLKAGNANLTSFLTNKLELLNIGTSWMGGTNTFHSLSIFDPHGKLLARCPQAEWREGEEILLYNERDHFKGATRIPAHGSPRPYVSRAYLSRTDKDGLHKFGISVALLDDDNSSLLGVFFAAITTASTRSLGDSEHEAVLIARVDPLDIEESEYVLIAHPGMDVEASGIPINRRTENWLNSTNVVSGVYFDSAAEKSPRFSGLWLAGKAAVPDSHFIVVVQSRDWVATATAITIVIMVVLGLFLFVSKRLRGTANRPN